MRVNPPAACASWPRTARRSAPGRPIRWSPRHWSRGRRPSTCWRWPGSNQPCAHEHVDPVDRRGDGRRGRAGRGVVDAAGGQRVADRVDRAGPGPRPPRRRYRRGARRPARPCRPDAVSVAGTGAEVREQLRGHHARMRRRRLAGRRRQGRRQGERRSSTCGPTGARRAPRNCPRWPSTSAGPDPTSRC